MADNNWEIIVGGRNSFGGYCPAYYDNTYAYHGNQNQLNAMVSINLLDPNVLTQGAGATDLTGGTEDGELGSELIKSITKHAVASNVAYACSDDKVFKITNTAVSNGSFPLTISSGAANVSTDLLYYKSKVYVFWNDTGVDGDIAQITLPSTIDDTWGSVTGGANLEDAPHYGIVGGDDVMYISNGKYIAKYDGTTLTVHGLDFHTNSEVVSLSWNHNRVYAAVNRPNISGSNFNLSAIYKWNGISPSWEGDPIEVSGQIGALYTKNGITYVWWKDGISIGGYNFGYTDGSQLKTICRYAGSLPNQAQVSEYEGHIGWISDNALLLWGAKDPQTPAKLFKYMAGKRATVGTWAAPFGTPIISSYASTNYSLAKATNYTVTSSFSTVAYDMRRPDWKAQIDIIQVVTEQMSANAAVDFILRYDQGKSSKSLTQVAYSSANETVHKILTKGVQVDDFRIEGNFANGNAINNVAIRSILISGHWIKQN